MGIMNKPDITIVDLERLAALMAQEIPTLECPECCGPIHEFVEIGARFHQEEMEWAILAAVLMHASRKRKAAGGAGSS
jgi:hypothetical protein